MLDLTQVFRQLHDQTATWHSAWQTRQRAIQQARAWVGNTATWSPAERQAQLARWRWPGCWPTHELAAYPDLIVPFPYTWTNHQDARAWALRILTGQPTIAVDGSQITPGSDFSLPIGLIQIGWFHNDHHAEGRFAKERRARLVWHTAVNEDADDTLALTEQINRQRYAAEIRHLIDQMLAWPKASTDPAPLCFYDGSLLPSFAGQMTWEKQKHYVDTINSLLAISTETRVPLVGYIDYSQAQDMVTMFGHLTGEHLPVPVHDIDLLGQRLPWGARTPIWLAGRRDGLGFKVDDQVCFTYVQTTRDRPPARLEFPRWVYTSNQYERIIDIVRAECIVGLGYPYALETADATAVLTSQDRQRFQALLQSWARDQGWPAFVPTKGVSKRRRRTP